LTKRNMDLTPANALSKEIHDALGIRIVTCFIDDIYRNIDLIRRMDGIEIIEEKDYLTNAKPNGYRSYHMIIAVSFNKEDPQGRTPGIWYAEIQLRTIAMDTWAALEHKLKYKHEIKDTALMVAELKRCADELAACDVSMQTIKNMIENT